MHWLDKWVMYIHCRNVMTTTVKKWGNSLALRLPKTLAEQVQISEGSSVEFLSTEQGLLLKPVRKTHYRLSDLVGRITVKNRHSETDWGTPAGLEKLP
jgi:antitoxin MazE